MSDKLKTTNRGFGIITLVDLYNAVFTIQKSSLATEDAIWFGIDEPKVKMLASQANKINPETGEMSGWVDIELPEGAEIMPTRMHLNRNQVRILLPILQHFVETGELPEEYELDLSVRPK